MKPLYLDYNATTPIALEVRQAMEPFLNGHYANPSSIYGPSRVPTQAIREARRHLAKLVDARDESDIIFTSGGTESNNAAIRSALSTQKGRNEIVISTVEHSSVMKLAYALRDEGFPVHEVPVDCSGRLKIDKLEACVSNQTAIVSIMLANNETGIIYPVDEISAIVRRAGALFHVDAVQAIGKIPVSVKGGLVDFLSVSGHKFYAPKGIGALYIRKGISYKPFIYGGSQERDRRAGTENVPGIVGLGQAARWAFENLSACHDSMQHLRDEFERRLIKKIPDVVIHSIGSSRLPNTSNIYIPGTDAESLLISLDQEGLYASKGSACMSGAHQPSHVLRAMGLSEEEANSTIRVSFGRESRIDDLNRIVERLQFHVQRLRNLEIQNTQSIRKEAVGLP